MAIRYWVGGTSADASDAANWSTSSGGSGGSAPGTSDTAILDGGTKLESVTAVSVSSNELAITSHGFSTEDPVWIECANEASLDGEKGSLPVPFAERTTYYVINASTHRIKLATNAVNAAAGTAISITDSGSGTIKIRKVTYCMPPDGFDVSSIEVHSTFAGTLFLQSAAITIRQGLYLNGNIEGASSSITFTTTPATNTSAKVDFASGGLYGSALAYSTRMVLNGQYAQITGDLNELQYVFAQTQSPLKFDDGPHPHTKLNAASGSSVVFSPEYVAPSSTTFDYYDDGVAYFDTMNIAYRASNPPEFRPNSNATNESTDGAKKFKVKTFACNTDAFDGGYAEWGFIGDTGTTIKVPLNNSNNYGRPETRFKCTIRKYKFTANTAGHIVNLLEGEVLHCETLEVGDGGVLRGPGYTTSTHSAEINCVKPPKVLGSWNFSQVAPGVYRSPLTQDSKFQAHTAHFRLASSVSSFASGAYTLCALDTTDFDTASAWTSGGSNYKWTVPRDGKYLIAYSASIRLISSSHIALAQVQINGSAITFGPYAKDSGWPSTGTILLNLSKNDYIQLFAYHNGGSGKELDGSALNKTFLSIMEVL